MKLKTPKDVTDKIRTCVRAGYQLIQIVTGNQWALAMQCITEAAAALVFEAGTEREEKTEVAVWNAAEGLRRGKTADAKLNNAVIAIKAVLDSEQAMPRRCLCVFQDGQPMTNKDFVVHLRHGATSGLFVSGHQTRPVILVSVRDELHPDLVPFTVKIELPLPDDDRLRKVVDAADKKLKTKRADYRQPTAEYLDRVTRSLRGLGDAAAVDALYETVYACEGWADDVPARLEAVKADVLAVGGCLRYVSPAEVAAAPELGGYDELLQWVRVRKAALFAPPGLLDPISGISLAGIPGTGKSVAGRVIARELALPLVTLDVRGAYSSLVGDTEKNIRDALKSVTAMRQAVLMIDEVDKALGGSHEATGDSGVTQGVLGTILTWMAEKTDPIFVVMTMNRTDGLPPELLRRGRLDEIFYVDLPNREELLQIFDIHCRRRRIDPAAYRPADRSRVAEEMANFVGAEVEAVVKDAQLRAFDRTGGTGTVPTADEFVAAAEALTPMFEVQKTAVEKIREFGKTQARNVRGGAPKTAAGRALDFEMTR